MKTKNIIVNGNWLLYLEKVGELVEEVQHFDSCFSLFSLPSLFATFLLSVWQFNCHCQLFGSFSQEILLWSNQNTSILVASSSEFSRNFHSTWIGSFTAWSLLPEWVIWVDLELSIPPVELYTLSDSRHLALETGSATTWQASPPLSLPPWSFG